MNYSIIVRLSKFQSTTLHEYSAWPTYTNTVACQRASSTTQFYKQHEDIKMDKILKKKNSITMTTLYEVIFQSYTYFCKWFEPKSIIS